MQDMRRYIEKHKDHILVYILVWLLFTLMFAQDALGKDYFVNRKNKMTTTWSEVKRAN